MELKFLEASKISQSLKDVDAEYYGDVYGELVLHMVNRVSEKECQHVFDSALAAADPITKERVLAGCNAQNIGADRKKFWKKSPDVSVRKALAFTRDYWQEFGLERNPEELEELQRLFINTMLFTHVLYAYKRPEFKSFIEKSIKKGFFG